MSENDSIIKSISPLRSVIGYLIILFIILYLFLLYVKVIQSNWVIKPELYVFLIYVFCFLFYKFSYSVGMVLRRCSLYYILFFASITGFYYVLSFFGRNYTNVDSARCLLSASIQSEAAMFAIVMSLSLIAVQQTASSYSTRIIEIFKSPYTNPDFYILLFFYIITFTYEMWVLKQIQASSTYFLLEFENKVVPNFEFHIEAAYLLASFSFIIIAPYTLNTLDLLRPFKIIKILSEKLTDKTLREGKEEYNDNHPMRQINDIVYNSLIKHDYKTAETGIEAMFTRVMPLLENDSFNKEEEKKLIIYLIRFHEDICRFAVVQGDHYLVIEILKNLNFIARINVSKNYDKDIVLMFLSSQEKISKLAIVHRDHESVQYILNSLDIITKLLIDNLNDEKVLNYLVKKIQLLLYNIAESSAEFGMSIDFKQAVKILGQIGEHAVIKEIRSGTASEILISLDNDDKDIVSMFLSSQEKISKLAIVHRDHESVQYTLNSLDFITESLIDNLSDEKVLNYLVKKTQLLLYDIAESLTEFGMSTDLKQAVNILGQIGEHAVIKEIRGGAISEIFISLTNIKQILFKQKEEKLIIEVALSFHKILKSLFPNHSIDSYNSLIYYAIQSLDDILKGFLQEDMNLGIVQMRMILSEIMGEAKKHNMNYLVEDLVLMQKRVSKK